MFQPIYTIIALFACSNETRTVFPMATLWMQSLTCSGNINKHVYIFAHTITSHPFPHLRRCHSQPANHVGVAHPTLPSFVCAPSRPHPATCPRRAHHKSIGKCAAPP